MRHRFLGPGAGCLALIVALNLGGNPAQAGGRGPNGVPPSQEIEILDPGVDPIGKPAVVLQQEDDKTKVKIPPTVLVHRYYYTGDRNFQAQLLPGGPSIVVLHHPKTGEQCYIEVQMPPGAPRVSYTGQSVEYDFGGRSVTIYFPMFCGPKVAYRNGISPSKAAARMVNTTAQVPGKLVRATGIPEHTAKLAATTKAAAGNMARGAVDLGKQLVAPIQGLVSSGPLGSLLKSDPAEVAGRQRDRAVKAVAEQTTRAEASLPRLP